MTGFRRIIHFHRDKVIFWMISAVLLVGLVACATSQRVDYGDCLDISVKTPFNASQYTGLWYEIEKDPDPFQAGLKCVTATYLDEGNYISILNTGVHKMFGHKQSIEGKATIPDPDVPAKLKVKLDNIPAEGDYWVLDTDYESYSLVYSCSSVWGVAKFEYLWILSRENTLDYSTKQTLYNLLDTYGIKRDYLMATNQDCE